VQTLLAVGDNNGRARFGMAFLDSMVLTQHSRCDSNRRITSAWFTILLTVIGLPYVWVGGRLRTAHDT
jgi:hypothetical protein